MTKLFSNADHVAKASGMANAMINNKATGWRHKGKSEV